MSECEQYTLFQQMLLGRCR